MKKKILSLCLASVLTVVTFTACGSSENVEQEDSVKEEIAEEDIKEEIQEDVQEKVEKDSVETDEETVSINGKEVSAEIAAVRDAVGSEKGYGFKEGQVLPTSTVLQDLNGDRIYLTDYLGAPLYINIFTTWCGPCNYEMPDYEECAETYEGSVNFLLVDVGDSVSDINAFQKEYGLTMPICYTDYYVGTEAIDSIPRQLVVDQYGIVVAYEIGGQELSWMKSICEEALGNQ